MVLDTIEKVFIEEEGVCSRTYMSIQYGGKKIHIQASDALFGKHSRRIYEEAKVLSEKLGVPLVMNSGFQELKAEWEAQTNG
jgi:HD-GYP domain-containing protein (c-di-GMP phosphodiesterase class II)